MSYTDELLNLMKEDKNLSNTYDRYPIRFLFTRLSQETYNDISELIIKMTKLQDKNHFNKLEVIRLSDYLNFNDGWLTKNSVYNIIKCLDSDKDYLIFGFSELARFYSKADLQSLIISFMTDIESNSQKSKQRIYFVCFSLFEKLSEVLKINGRNENINPIIYHMDFVDSDSICVYYANSNFEVKSMTNKIRSTSEWLSLFEQKNIDFDKGIVCLSDTLVAIYEKAKPDNFVEIHKIDSYFSLLVRMCGLNITNKDEAFFEDSFWKAVYDITEKTGFLSLKNIVLNYLKAHSINEESFVELFKKTDLFGKKLMMLYVYENENDIRYADYLKNILQNSYKNSFSTFINDLVSHFDILNDTLYFDSRKFFIEKLFELKFISSTSIQDQLLISLNKCMNSFIANKILTSKLNDENILEISVDDLASKYNQNINYLKTVFNLFFKEFLTKAIIGKFKIEQYIIMNFVNNDFITVNDACSLYPDLRSYLGTQINSYINSSKYWLSKYIYSYKESKILSKATDEFIDLSNKNNEEFMYDWYNNSDLLHQQDMIDKNVFDKLIILDGVGIEYFDFIINVIKENKMYINYANYAKSYLPSITSINKDKLNNYDKWIIEFDKNIIHGNVFNIKKSLPDSLHCLRSIIESLIADYPNLSICIAADHGCTCQSKLIPYNKKYNFEGSDHEGRCMEVKNENNHIASSKDYTVYHSINDNKKYVISLNNISLSDKPIREVHGGATIEECFVPCIVFSNKNEVQNYNINPIKTTVNGLDKIIKIEITPKPKNQPLYIDEFGNQGVFTNEGNNVWSVKLQVITNQNIKIAIGSFSDKLNVCSSSGITKKGDDGFDD